MESRVREALSAFPPVESRSALETMEHLALLRRWYYRSSRVGEIFFADAQGRAAAAPDGERNRASVSRGEAGAGPTEATDSALRSE